MTDLGNKANSSKIDRGFSCQFVSHQPKRFKKSRPMPKLFDKNGGSLCNKSLP